MVYTKTGDNGSTSLANGKRVSKTDARIEAYGTVDELNSWIGLLRASIADSQVGSVTANSQQLAWVQNKLFNLGASLSEAPGEWICETDVHQLEQWIDAMQAELPPQRAFILPAGSESVCRCHLCRTVCRRAERRIESLRTTTDADRNMELKFINRLSDYLFVLSRFIGHMLNEPEEAWKQG